MEVYTLALIGAGGLVGAISRYLLSGWVQGNYSGFPYGTLAVNFTGSLLLSVIMYLSEYSTGMPSNVRILLTVGFLGAYTTMSTFGFESFRLLEQGETVRFLLNLLGTNALVLVGVWLGRLIALRLSGVAA
ncbi:TPA: fluoride efflux transporter CrcB [Candidatus Bathyarchaeota archaeon]|nr:fluoride efflux transporter CrcB [Candidatus Bathyarchaeota archaeon]